MSRRKYIPVSDIALDRQNARLLDDQPDEPAALLALAEQDQLRLLRLAEDIVAQEGLSPLELPAVIPLPEAPGRYWVIEGNRRVAALKALGTPSLVEPVYSGAAKKKWAELNRRFEENPLVEIECAVFDSEADVEPWVELRHGGQQGGVGLVEWGAREKERWARRHGRGEPWGEIMDFVQDKGALSPEAQGSKKGVLTSVRRLIGTPDVRHRLGIEVQGRRVFSHYPLEEVSKGLSRIVEDLLTEQIRVGDIYHVNQRLSYIQSIPKEDLPDPETRLDDAVPLDELTPSPGGDPKKAKKKKHKKKTRPQEVFLIPRDVALEIPPRRIYDIYDELKRLELASFTNSAAVLLRVFLELSVDSYLSGRSLLTKKDSDSPLAKRLKKAADDLKDRGMIDGKLHTAVEQVADGKFAIAASTPTLNQYVHNEHVFPAASELRAAWNQLQGFFEALWPSS